jgi:hypothetical protein
MASKCMAYALLEAERDPGESLDTRPCQIRPKLAKYSSPPPKEGKKASPSLLDPEPLTKYKT